MAHQREWLPRSGAVAAEVISEDYGSTPSVVLRHQQDVTPVLDDNARMRSYQQHGTPKMGAKLAARIPEIHYYIQWPTEFQAKHGMHPQRPDLSREWARFVRRKLNDRDFSQFRVDTGRL